MLCRIQVTWCYLHFHRNCISGIRLSNSAEKQILVGFLLWLHWICLITFFLLLFYWSIFGASMVAQMVKNLPAMWEIQVQFLGREDPPRDRNGSPLQYSCLENPTDREAWQATVHGVAKSQDWKTTLLLLLNLIYNVSLVSGIQQSNSVNTPTHTYSFPLCFISRYWI